MPQPKLGDNLVEYTFTIEEYKAARLLNPLQIALLHTLRAKLVKQKAFAIIPGKDLEYDFVKDQCTLEGRIEMIQELFDLHEAVLKEVSDPLKHEVNPNAVVDDTQARAAAKVHTS